ncbi:MAG: Npt1/Npt2 family nucleotide transporter [Bacteroidota bacterium]
MDKQSTFGRIRSRLFPIHKNEFSKLIPLTILSLLISFSSFTLRSLKDIYLLKYINAEVIYYIKVFGVIPGIILLTILYSSLSKFTHRDTRFNIVIGYFLVFFGLFYFVFIPHLALLKLNNWADALHHRFPAMHHLWEALRFWPFTLFYIHAEAWFALAQGVLFWTFVNEITSLEQAKRLYGFLPLGFSIAFLLEGLLLRRFKKEIGLILGLNIGVMAAILIVYNGLAHYIKKHPALWSVAQKPTKKPKRLSLTASFKFLAKSEYLALITSIVISYGVVTSLFEALWKAKVKEWAAADTSLLVEVYSIQAIFGGLLALFLALFVSAPVMNRGFRFAASVAPLAALVATSIFFTGLYFQDILSGFHSNALAMVVKLGVISLTFIKIARYILFDPSKERAYIPLDEELKVRGKAAVDGVGARLGKSLGSLMLTTLLLPVLGSIEQAKHVIFLIILITIGLWLRAVRRLSVLFDERTQEEAEQR